MNDTNASESPFAICAVGAQDRTLTVWQTNRPRVLFALQDITNNHILDISWSKDGRFALLCSTDGHIVHLAFSENELGIAVPDADMVNYSLNFRNNIFSKC